MKTGLPLVQNGDIVPSDAVKDNIECNFKID